MEFQSAKEAAQRMGISLRAVQKQAKEGKIPGAKKNGREWLIPLCSENTQEKFTHSKEKHEKASVRIMPLMCGCFKPGNALTYIESLKNKEEHAIAVAEYYYFSGRPDKVIEITEKYMKSKNVSVKLSAALMYCFSSVAFGRTNAAHYAISIIEQELKKAYCNKNTDETTLAYCVLIAYTTKVLFHINIGQLPPLESIIKNLPDGLKFFACYLLAHMEYLKGNYERSLGIAGTAFMISGNGYIIPSIYTNLIITMNLMSLGKVNEAKNIFNTAWKTALQDDFIEAFAEHHGLLQGTIEVCLKNAYPEYYKKIIKMTYEFSAGWRKIHNPTMNEQVADNLTTTEFTVAMLYNRGWSMNEIAEYLHISKNTVKYHISMIYEKLCIKNRKELSKYMLK